MAEHDLVELDPTDLDGQPEGADLNRADYLTLGLLGVLVPALLLIWGWL